MIAGVDAENYGVYRVGKMHAALRRDGVVIGRDQTGRLMRELGLAGVRRAKFTRTTIRDDVAARPADLVDREFRAQRPDQLGVADLTHLRTWAGFAYLALVIDVFSRRIIGWALASHMPTELPAEALELPVWTPRADRLNGLTHTPTPAVNISPSLRRRVVRGRRPGVGRQRRRLAGQRTRRVHDRADQGRPDQAARTMAHDRAARARAARVQRLVEPPPPVRRDQHDPARRGRLLRRLQTVEAVSSQ